MSLRVVVLAGSIGILLTASLGAHEGHVVDVPVDGPPPLFEPPAPGTYELPPIQGVSERELLDSSGERAPLLGLRPDQVAVVSFVYRGCADADGCPLALAVLRRLDRSLAERESLAARVRMVTASFDAKNDTRGRMAELRSALAPRSDWRFLTAGGDEEIAPVLAEFGQDTLRLIGTGGEPTPLIRHVLKVFLVDGERRVRNVYSAGFLDARLLMNDLETVLAPD
jgi:cytochrome c peroxidase